MSFTITRANVEAELIDRVGALLALVGKDGTTVNGTNPSLAGPIRGGLASLGIVPATFPLVVDADLSTVIGTQVDQLYDISELYALRNIQAAYLFVDESVNRDQVKNDQLGQRIEKRLTDLTALAKATYGYGTSAVTGGSISLDFQSTNPCAAEFGGEFGSGHDFGWPIEGP